MIKYRKSNFISIKKEYTQRCTQPQLKCIIMYSKSKWRKENLIKDYRNYIERDDKEMNTISGFNSEDDNNLYNALRGMKRPYEIGTIMMYYVVDTYPKKERMNIIRKILRIFSVDFFTFELPKGELDRFRRIVDKI